MTSDLVGAVVRDGERTGRVRAVVTTGRDLLLYVQVDGRIERWNALGLEVIQDAEES